VRPCEPLLCGRYRTTHNVSDLCRCEFLEGAEENHLTIRRRQAPYCIEQCLVLGMAHYLVLGVRHVLGRLL
jgi:hypothetical protein